MASLQRHVDIAQPAEAVWDAVRDYGQLHVRIAPGLVTDTVLEEDGAFRTVTFANGMSLREALLGADDENRRLAWSAASDLWHHHNASLTVSDLSAGKSRTTWIADVLPDEARETIAMIMEMGLGAMKAHIESDNASDIAVA
jgi:Polyketide cyclase / dehydrase and lipid transport